MKAAKDFFFGAGLAFVLWVAVILLLCTLARP